MVDCTWRMTASMSPKSDALSISNELFMIILFILGYKVVQQRIPRVFTTESPCPVSATAAYSFCSFPFICIAGLFRKHASSIRTLLIPRNNHQFRPLRKPAVYFALINLLGNLGFICPDNFAEQIIQSKRSIDSQILISYLSDSD